MQELFNHKSIHHKSYIRKITPEKHLTSAAIVVISLASASTSFNIKVLTVEKRLLTAANEGNTLSTMPQLVSTGGFTLEKGILNVATFLLIQNLQSH